MRPSIQSKLPRHRKSSTLPSDLEIYPNHTAQRVSAPLADACTTDVNTSKRGSFEKSVCKFGDTEGAEPVGFSHSDFGFVVQPLDYAAGKLFPGAKIVEGSMQDRITWLRQFFRQA